MREGISSVAICGRREALWLGVLGLGVIGLCLAARLFLELGVGWRCPFLTVLHLPCPSCGSTRALAALSQLEFGKAFLFNPLLISMLPACIVMFLFRNKSASFPFLCSLGWSLLIGAVLLNWAYLILFLPR